MGSKLFWPASLCLKESQWGSNYAVSRAVRVDSSSLHAPSAWGSPGPLTLLGRWLGGVEDLQSQGITKYPPLLSAACQWTCTVKSTVLKNLTAVLKITLRCGRVSHSISHMKTLWLITTAKIITVAQPILSLLGPRHYSEKHRCSEIFNLYSFFMRQVLVQPHFMDGTSKGSERLTTKREVTQWC